MNLNRRAKIAIGAVAALALAVSLGAAGAIAASRVLSADDDRQAVLDDAAQQLGVTPGALEDALKEALKNRVDEAVQDGRLTEEQGTRLKEHIDAGAAPLVLGGLGHRGFGVVGPFGHFGRLGHFGHIGSLEAAASYLDLTEAELRERLVDGDTLAEIAKAEGKSVDGLVEALVAAGTEKIDEAAADGHLTEERAAELKEGLEGRITDLVNGELRMREFRFRGRGFEFRSHGPWDLTRPRPA